MTFPKFLKRKSTYIILIIILIVGGLVLRSRAKSGQPTYETQAVTRLDLKQTVEVTGDIKPADRIGLSFKNSGTIHSIKVQTGDKVKAGDILADLQADDVTFAARNAAAAYSIAEANLNARLAGETSQSIKVSEASVEQAQAAYDKAASDLDSIKQTTANSVNVSQLAVQTAQNDLNNQDAIVTQNIQNAYASTRTAFNAALGPLQSGLTDGDQITAVDNTSANALYLNQLGFLDSSTMPRAKNSYLIAKTSKIAAEQAVRALTPSSSKEDIQAAGDKLVQALRDMQTYLTDVQKVLSATLTSATFSATDLNSKNASINADLASISTQNTTVLTATQSLTNTELTRTQTIAKLQDAYTTAQTNLKTAQTNATTQVNDAQSVLAVQKAALDSAKASLDLKKAPPRNVDVQNLRAAVEQAQVNLDKANNDLKNIQIIAPVDGTIGNVIPSVGELAQPGIAAINLVGTNQYDIEALVPEADIAKVMVGQTATITLDAFGDDQPFTGAVTAEDPDLTKVQDAVYYKVRVQIDPGGKDIKPGMTANVTIKTGEAKNALVIPLRAVRTRSSDNAKTIRVMVNNQPQEKVIEIGLHGDEGQIEVTSGLSENETVIVSETVPGATP